MRPPGLSTNPMRIAKGFNSHTENDAMINATSQPMFVLIRSPKIVDVNVKCYLLLRADVSPRKLGYLFTSPFGRGRHAARRDG